MRLSGKGMCFLKANIIGVTGTVATGAKVGLHWLQYPICVG